MSVRRDLVGEQPLLAGIAAPDLDADAFLPVHPGAAAYFNGTQESFFDRYSNLIYMTPMVLGALASIFAAAWRFLGVRAKDAAAAPTDLLCDLSARIRQAGDEAALAALEAEIDRMLHVGLAIILAFERMADPPAGLGELFAGGGEGTARTIDAGLRRGKSSAIPKDAAP